MRTFSYTFPQHFEVPKEIWGVDDIAHYVSKSKNFVFTLVHQTNFPKPIIGQYRHRRWVASEVKTYLSASRPSVTSKGECFINSDLVTR
jgi:predicted DNA-binding transcriptional regulator AlpA